mgnify:CR=1 FL=1
METELAFVVGRKLLCFRDKQTRVVKDGEIVCFGSVGDKIVGFGSCYFPSVSDCDP